MRKEMKTKLMEAASKGIYKAAYKSTKYQCFFVFYESKIPQELKDKMNEKK